MQGVTLVTRSSPGDSNNENSVTKQQHTGDSGMDDGFVVTTFHEATDVMMTELTPNVILSYIATNEPMDKAGESLRCSN